MLAATVNADTYDGWLKDGRDFIDDGALRSALAAPVPAPVRVREILARSLEVSEALSTEDVAALLAVEDPALLEEIFEAARAVKRKVLHTSHKSFNTCKVLALITMDHSFGNF